MKKQTMYNRLQKQYEKLNQSIQKAMKTGRFYAYTQFKQEQLLSRLKRCSFQLKQLGAGVAVVAALGVATPAVGQHVPDFIQRTGLDNPCQNIDGYNPEFVDIDGDGDLDCFVSRYSATLYNNALIYYKNTGDSTNAIYTEQTSANNPFNNELGIKKVSFADIDGDGDLDGFTAAEYNYDNRTMTYYENIGTATSPSFSVQTTANNPLGMVVTTYGLGKAAVTSFVDIDNDNDIDCFVGLVDVGVSSEVLYYKNMGTVTSPSFVLQTPANNPLSDVNSILRPYIVPVIDFKDLDTDGDKDAFISANFQPSGVYFKYYENTGTIASSNFVLGAGSMPLDSIPFNTNSSNNYRIVRLLDIDNDTDLDVVTSISGTGYHLWENQDSVVYNATIEVRNKNLESIIYPNPTSGSLSFEESISGKAKLYNISGQLVLDVKLEDEQSLNIEFLNNGIYFLEIQTAEGRIREKVILQK